MTAKQWKSKIKKACVTSGCYQKSFDIAICILADILERRDKALSQYVAEGEQLVVEYTNKSGATNLDKNKLVGELEKCEEQAIKYLSELGLTAKGFKSVGGEVEKKEEGSFEKLFADLGI